jgi:DNA replication protein DnaC
MKHVRIKVCPQPGNCPGAYIATNLAPDHPQFGQVLPCACTRRQQADALKRSLPSRLHTMTFETFVLNNGNREAVTIARRFAGEPWTDKFLLTLVGPNQQGKTHLAMAILQALLARGEPAYFENVPALLDRLRGGYDDGQFWHTFDRAKHAPVLALDDLGAEYGGRSDDPNGVTWAEDKLYQIIDQRVLHELPTIITTNLTRKMLSPRIAARLWNGRYAIVVAIAGTSDKTGVAVPTVPRHPVARRDADTGTAGETRRSAGQSG